MYKVALRIVVAVTAFTVDTVRAELIVGPVVIKTDGSVPPGDGIVGTIIRSDGPLETDQVEIEAIGGILTEFTWTTEAKAFGLFDYEWNNAVFTDSATMLSGNELALSFGPSLTPEESVIGFVDADPSGFSLLDTLADIAVDSSSRSTFQVDGNLFTIEAMFDDVDFTATGPQSVGYFVQRPIVPEPSSYLIWIVLAAMIITFCIHRAYRPKRS